MVPPLPTPLAQYQAHSRKRHPLGEMLDEDALVITDAVLDGAIETVRHGPPRSFIEGDRSQILDPCVQLEVRVPCGGDHRFALYEQSPSEALALVVWLNEQVDKLMPSYREVANRDAINDCDPRLEIGVRPEPITQLLPGAFTVGRLNLASKQQRGVSLPEAAVVIVRNHGGIVGRRYADLDHVHA